MDWFSNLFKKNEKNEKIEELPSMYEFINQKKENITECVICLENMNFGDKLVLLPCSHIYHSKCLHMWIEKKRICPLCDSLF